MAADERARAGAHPLDPHLDRARLDPCRGLERSGEDWTLFGLSLDPEAWLAADDETLTAIADIWLRPEGWKPEDAGTLHGLVVGARAELRALARDGVELRDRALADLGGCEGYYAVAAVLEGVRRVVLVDEEQPRPMARGVLEAAGVEIVIDPGCHADLTGIDTVLALASLDPDRLMLFHPEIRTGIVATAHGPWRALVDELTTVAAERALSALFRVRVARCSTRFAMGRGACALLPDPIEVEIQIRERIPASDRIGHDPGEENATGSASDVATSVDPPIADLREASLLFFEHLNREPRSEPPRVAPIVTSPVRTGFGLIDSGLGGVVPGHVHLVVATVHEVRTAVLAELVMTWPHQHTTPSLLAGPGPISSLVATLLGASSGVSRRGIETGDLSYDDWSALTLMAGIGNQAGLPYLFSGDIRCARDLDASLIDYRRRPPTIVVVDLAELTLADLEGWIELARARGLPVVIGLDARCAAAREHTLPELMLSRIATSPARARFAAHGARIDGSFSHRMIVDVDLQTLSVATYDPTNESRAGELPDDAELAVTPEETWATPDAASADDEGDHGRDLDAGPRH